MYNGKVIEVMDESSDEDESPVTEMRFVPADSTHCKYFGLFLSFVFFNSFFIQKKYYQEAVVKAIFVRKLSWKVGLVWA